MKILIIYSSMTGNTKKLSEAINERLKGDKTLCSIDEAPGPEGYDLIVLGFWLMAGRPDPRSSRYLEKIGKTKLFLFATHGAAVGTEHVRMAMSKARSLATSADLMGTFSCQGEVAPQFLEKALAKNPQPPWIGDAASAAGHPDTADIQHLCEALTSQIPDFLT